MNNTDLDQPEHNSLERLAAAITQATASVLPPITMVNRSEPLPISFAQQRLWCLEQVGLVGSAYHRQSSVRLVEMRQVEAFRSNLDIDSHMDWGK